MDYKNRFYDEIIPAQVPDDEIEKGKQDVFVPVTTVSKRFKQWVVVEDFRTCANCLTQKGKIYPMEETPNPRPPLHMRCRCSIQPMQAIEAGNATTEGKNGADFWLKYFRCLPSYYISERNLEQCGWKRGKKPRNTQKAGC